MTFVFKGREACPFPKPRLSDASTRAEVESSELRLPCCIYGLWETLITLRLMSPEMRWGDKLG